MNAGTGNNSICKKQPQAVGELWRGELRGDGREQELEGKQKDQETGRIKLIWPTAVFFSAMTALSTCDSGERAKEVEGGGGRKGSRRKRLKDMNPLTWSGTCFGATLMLMPTWRGLMAGTMNDLSSN